MEANNEHIDLTYLKELSNGSNEFILQMISVFMAQTPEAIGDLEKHLDHKDWKALRAVAHKMKPSFSFMGIKELEPVIAAVEEYSKDETNLDELPAMISRIKNICLESMKELEAEKKAFM